MILQKMEDKSFETELLHTPYAKPDAYNALSMPVYNSAAYEFDSAEQMESAFTGKTSEFEIGRASCRERV